MPEEADPQKQQQYVNVLREAIAGDTLGQPQDGPDGSPVCAFQFSGKAFPEAIILEMLADKLLVADKDFGVTATEKGRKMFTRLR